MSRMTPEHKAEHCDAMKHAIRTRFAAMIRVNGDASMAALAQGLGIAKGTLYIYYSSKDELLADILKAGRDAMFARMEAEMPPDMPPAEKLRQWARIMIEDFIQQRYLRAEFRKRNPLRKGLPERNLNLLMKILREGMEQGIFRSDLDLEETALFLFCAMVGKFHHCLKNDLSLEPVHETELFCSLILPGLVKS